MSNRTEFRKLKELFAFRNGRAFKKHEWSDKGLPIIRIQNLNNPAAPFNYFPGKYSDDVLVQQGDLLFSWSGTVGSSFGPHIWRREAGVLNQHIFKISLDPKIEKKYAYYALRQITGAIEARVNGAVGLVHITKEKLNEFQVPVPPLPEQQRIAAVLDKGFAAIATAKANTEKNLLNARALLDSELDAAFTESGPSRSHRVPLSSILSVQPRNGWSPPLEYQNGAGIPVLTLSSVTGFEYDGTRIKLTSAPTRRDAHYWLRPGELLITRSNTRELVGHVAIYDGNPAKAICCDLIMKMQVDPTAADTRFIYYYLRSPEARRYFTTIAHGASSTMKKIGKTTVQNIKVPLPPLHRQRSIAATLDQIATGGKRLRAKYIEKLDALQALQKALLHRAFAGNL